MGYKYFGRLAGSTPAANAVTLTSPANTSTPFTAVLPASKFLAQGENATSNVFNRGLAALSVNTDALAGVLDSPALRNEVLEPRPVGVGQPGYSALVGVAAGTQDINLSAGADRPVTWVHVGLHRDLLSRHLQAERMGPSAPLADGRQLLTPTDVFLNATLAGTSTSYFPTTQYTGTSDNALALRIPGVVAVATGLPPYSGAPAPSAVGSFDADGCRLSSRSWEDLYARPGCLVAISGSGSNRGLYRIANMSGGATAGTAKAVLTRAYTEVTVLDGTLYSAGDLVGWRPSNQAVAGVVTNYVHRAYVVFKIATGVNDEAVLYLSDVGGSEDLKIQGTSVAHKANPASSGTSSISRYGLVDLEAGATQNASFAVGALLLNLATVGANPVANHASEILGILPANHPVKFETAVAAYNATVCAPPGYVLNPVVRLPANSMGGDFRLHAQSLTTAGENLRTGGGTASKGSFAPSTRLEFSPGYQSVMEGFLSWAHRGDDAGTGAGAQSSLFAPTRQVLGEGLWHITFTASLPAIPAGTAVSIVPQPTYTAYVARVVRASGTSLWVKRVHLDGKQYGNDHPAIAAGGTMLYSAVTYTVATVSEPGLESTVGVYVPDDGLNAAYHNHYSADPGIRGNQGKGNRIKAAADRPLTVELPNANDSQVGLRVESDRQGSGQRYTVLRANARGTALVASPDMALEVVDGTTLRIKDANATAGVRFSGPGAGAALDPTFATLGVGNLVGAVNQTAGLLAAAIFCRQYSHLFGAEVTAAGPAIVNVTDGTFVGTFGQTVYVPSIAGLAASGAGVVVWNTSSDVYQFVSGGNLSVVQEPVAYVSLPTIVDLRLTQRGVQYRTDIYVGGGPGQHFDTVGKAVQFVRQISQLTGWGQYSRRWRIQVRGPVEETATVAFGGVKGVVIEGFGEGTTISWGDGFDTLFDLGGADDLVFRNLHLKYDSASSAAVSPTQRRVFYNNTSTSQGVLIEGVRTEAVQNRLSCYGVLTHIKHLTIRDCRFEGATDVGFLIGSTTLGQECEFLTMTGVIVKSQGAPQATPSGTSHFGIKLLGCREGVRLTDCRVRGWTYCGVWVSDCLNDVVLRGLAVVGVSKNGTSTDPIGVLLQKTGGSAAYGHVLENCDVSNVGGAGTTASGIECTVPGSLISGNLVSPFVPSTGVTGYVIAAPRIRASNNSYVPIPIHAGTIELGMLVGDAYCIILGNQTGGRALNISLPYVPTTTDVANRDDP